MTTTQDKIAAVCDEVKTLLLEKNKSYGDSAISPVRIFSKADPEEAILVRIDDKLSRIAKGSSLGEDVILDLIGYLVLLRVSRDKAVITKATMPDCGCSWHGPCYDHM